MLVNMWRSAAARHPPLRMASYPGVSEPMLHSGCMRSWALVFFSLSLGCGRSTLSKDSAAPLDEGGSDSNLAPDADLCAYSLGYPPDASLCAPPAGWGIVLDLGVDAGSCASRPTIPCNGSCDQLVANLVNNCGEWPDENELYVTFSHGCANHLYLPASLADFPTVACLAQTLDASHFACADRVACWEYLTSTLF